MKSILKKLIGVTADSCITIILNTHPTNPDSAVDGIQLKNLVKQAEQR